MEISLTPELEKFVHHQVESGKFASPSDVVLAAVQSYEELERVYKERYDALQNDINIGLEASERGEVLSEEEVFGPLHEKLKKRRAQAN